MEKNRNWKKRLWMSLGPAGCVNKYSVALGRPTRKSRFFISNLIGHRLLACPSACCSPGIGTGLDQPSLGFFRYAPRLRLVLFLAWLLGIYGPCPFLCFQKAPSKTIDWSMTGPTSRVIIQICQKPHCSHLAGLAGDLPGGDILDTKYGQQELIYI